MSKEREISNEQILYLLINLREEDAKRDSFTDIKVNREQCKAIGLFKYKLKETGKVRTGRLFLISETHDGELVNIIYDDKGRFIGWKNNEKDEIEVARDIELNTSILNQQLTRGMERERIRQESGETSSSDTAKAGEGRDLANKEHEEKEEIKKNENNEPKKIDGKLTQLENLKGEVNIDNKPRIRLDEIINGYYLWEILQIEEKLKGRLPDGISEKSFRNGYLTIIDSKELEAKDGKERKAEDTFAVCTYSGDIIELDEQILEPQYLGTRDERMQKESNRIRYADGKEVAKPDTDIDLTRTSKWRIPNVNERFTVNEEWYLGVDINRGWKENGERPTVGKIKEVTFIQEPRENDQVYSRDSAEARTRESIEYKLEDATEPPLSEKEQKQMEQLRKKDANETINVRKEHREELEQVVEKLTEKFGESYRNTIEKEVEEYHKKGMDAKDIEKNVKEEIEDIENEYYVHGRSRNH